MRDVSVHAAFEVNYHGLLGIRLLPRVACCYRRVKAGGLRGISATADPGADVLIHDIALPLHGLGECLGAPSVPACLPPFWYAYPGDAELDGGVPCPAGAEHAFISGDRAVVPPSDGLGRGVAEERFAAAGGCRGHAIASRGWRISDGSAGLQPRCPTRSCRLSEERTNRRFLVSGRGTRVDTIARSGGIRGGREKARLRRFHKHGRFRSAGPCAAGASGSPNPAYKAIVATGGGGIDSRGTNGEMMTIDNVPHQWRFPRVAAVVHRGGVGTTGAALPAGKPQVVCPFAGGQPYFASKLHQLGVAPAPRPQRSLSAESLARALSQQIGDERFRINAETLGHRVRREEGAGAAVRVIGTTVDRQAHAPGRVL